MNLAYYTFHLYILLWNYICKTVCMLSNNLAVMLIISIVFGKVPDSSDQWQLGPANDSKI